MATTMAKRYSPAGKPRLACTWLTVRPSGSARALAALSFTFVAVMYRNIIIVMYLYLFIYLFIYLCIYIYT